MVNIAVVQTRMPIRKNLDDSLGVLVTLEGKSMFLSSSIDIRDSGYSSKNKAERKLRYRFLKKTDGNDLGAEEFLRHKF